MSESHKTNQNAYNIWSEFYDTYSNPTVAIDDLHFPSYYAHEKNKHILEIGCGTGRHTARLAQFNNRITAVDFSEGMLNQARQKIKSAVHFILGDFQTLDLPANIFDAAVMSLVLEHIKDLPSFFTKVHGLLKPGGLFYFSELHPARTAQGIKAHFKTSSEEEIRLESSAHTEEEIKKAAGNSGFTVLKMETVYGHAELAKINPKWEKFLSQPMIQICVLEKNQF